MLKWAPYPFLRITPAFIAGILSGYYTRFPLSFWLFLAFLLLYTALVVCTPRRHLFYMSIPAGLSGLLLIFLAGFIIIHEKQENTKSNHIAHIQEAYQYYTATVIEPPQRRGQVFRTIVSVHQLIWTDSLKQVQVKALAEGKVMLYQPDEDSLKLLQYGDQILIKGKPQSIQAPANPYEFDYRQHLATQHIYHQQYLAADDWQLYGNQPPWSMVALANNLRSKSKAILLQNVPGQEHSGIALALTLGIKDYLDSDIKASYAATGAMHVLAVSGLHVGIIYLVLSLLLRPLLRIPGAGPWLRAGICIAALWLYALLAGWSPSVLRAASMFTFIIIGQATRWQTNIYNTLAASAFFLLCYDPLLILTVGFQLSYLAVTGIIYLQPKIYQWFEFNHWLPDKIWSLTSVSMAAQIATLPISLYYFHQFPVYFWLSNLLVIPAAFVILSLGLLTILTGMVLPVASTLTGWVLSKIILVVNGGIAAIERLPASTWQNISINIPQTFVLYGLIITILLLFHYRRFRYVTSVFTCILIFVTLYVYRFYQQNQQKSITFYKVDGQTNVDFTHGMTNFHLGEYNDKAQYHISPNHMQAGLFTTFISTHEQKKIAVKTIGNLRFCVWQGKSVVFIEHPFNDHIPVTGKTGVDIVVISNNAVKNLASLTEQFDFPLLVIDSSNNKYRAQKLAEEAREAGIKYHAVPLQGALTLHIPD